LLCALAALCTCSLSYTMSTRRKGKKGAIPILKKLLCPCCIAQRERKEFVELDPSSDEEGLDSEYSHS
jgi:hypothetical protein